MLAWALRERKWLVENLDGVLGKWPQIKIDRSQEVGVMIVVGGQTESLRSECERIREFPVMVSQLYLLRNDDGWAVLVV